MTVQVVSTNRRKAVVDGIVHRIRVKVNARIKGIYQYYTGHTENDSRMEKFDI